MHWTFLEFVSVTMDLKFFFPFQIGCSSAVEQKRSQTRPVLAELIIRSAYLGSLLFFYPVSPWKLHLITPDTSVNIYWFLYWIIWIFGKFFFLFSFVIFCVAKLLVSLQPSNFFSLSSSTAHILVIVNLMPVNYREAEFTFLSNAEEERGDVD